MKKENMHNLTEFEKEAERSLKIALKRSRRKFSAITKQYVSLCKKLDDIKEILLTTHAKIRSQ